MAISAHALCVNDGADRKRAPIQGGTYNPCEQVVLRCSRQLGRRSLHQRIGAQGAVCVPGRFSYSATSDKAALPMGLSAQAKIRQTYMTLTGGRNGR